MNNNLSKYLHAFKRLNISRSHGIAPHKPVLLVSVIQLYKNNTVNEPRIYMTPELVALFKSNWSVLVKSGKYDCRISYPFYYLKSDKFWKLVPKDGFENVNSMGSVMKSLNNLNAAVECAQIDEELFELLKDTHCSSILLQFLLDEYFPETKQNYSSNTSGQLQMLDDIENKIFKDSGAEYRQEIKKLLEDNQQEEIFIRGSLFKREIPRIYNYTCCISGMRVDTIDNISMVDACHIVPFSESYDDTVTNGIALCPNLHRAFDRGLIAIDEDYKVVVSKSFMEDESNYTIKAFEGKEINLPKMKSYYPLRENFGWHRKNVYKA